MEIKIGSWVWYSENEWERRKPLYEVLEINGDEIKIDYVDIRRGKPKTVSVEDVEIVSESERWEILRGDPKYRRSV